MRMEYSEVDEVFQAGCLWSWMDKQEIQVCITQCKSGKISGIEIIMISTYYES